MAATNQPTTSGFVDAILSNQELRNSLARAVESSGTGRQAVTRFNDVEQEVSNVFRPGSATFCTSDVLPTTTVRQATTSATPALAMPPVRPIAPIFQMRRNYSSQSGRSY